MSKKLFWLMILLAASLLAQNDPGKKQSSAAPASPETACPWLTEGSAAKVLGGQVRVVVSVTNPTQGTCTFFETAHRQDQLKVFVGASSVPSCPAGSAKVTGIGNQAVQCRLKPSAHGATQMVSSRVRAIYLAVTLTGGSGNGNQDAIEQIAEQVAGNLF